MLKDYLTRHACLGVVRSRHGAIRLFCRRGVIDLLELCDADPHFLSGADIADKIVGRGAALLMVRGKVASVYAQTISSGALAVLRQAGICVDYDKETPMIINRDGTGQCPVEQLTAATNDPEVAFILIKAFIKNKTKGYETQPNSDR